MSFLKRLKSSMHSRQVLLTFTLSFLPFLTFPLLFPTLKLAFFAPFLVVLFYKKPLIACLSWAVACGILCDSVSGYNHLGLHSLAFTLTTLCLYPQRKNFFEDSASTLPVMTAFYSALSTAALALLLPIFEQPIPLTLPWVLTDLVAYPCADALYAYLLFTLPGWVMPQSSNHEYFL